MTDVVEVYDQIAAAYDERYVDETCRLENLLVATLVKDVMPAGTMLDVGCGTGLALELGLAEQDRYLGVDPSGGMLRRFAEKFPHVVTLQMSFQEWQTQFGSSRFDGLISLFGSPSYLEAEYTERLFELAPNLVLMHYIKDYWPSYEPKPSTEDEAREAAHAYTLDHGGEVLYLNNFQICVLKRS